MYAYLVMSAFCYFVTIPTSALYINHFLNDTRTSGLLIATFEYSAGVLQPLQTLVLAATGKEDSWLGLNVVYIIMCLLSSIGCILYTLALPLNSLAVVFVGRAFSGVSAGNQLFSTQISRTTIDYKKTHQIDETQEQEKAQEHLMFAQATRYEILAYKVGGSTALVVAAIFGTFMTKRFDVDVNVATAPTIVAAVIPLLLIVAALVYFRNTIVGAGGSRGLSKKAPGKADTVEHSLVEKAGHSSGSAVDAWIGIVGVLLTSTNEGLRHVTSFELSHIRWGWDLQYASLFASAMFFLPAFLLPFDHPWYKAAGPMPSSILYALFILLAAPWMWDATFGSIMFTIASLFYGFFGRIIYTQYFVLVYHYISSTRDGPKHPLVYVACLSIGQSFGLAIGATIATLFDLSVYTFVAVAAVQIVSGGVLMWRTRAAMDVPHLSR
jgi:hypothetical protein